MKKMLPVWLCLGLTVTTTTGLVSTNRSKNTNKYLDFLTNLDDFLYYQVDSNFNKIELSNDEVEAILTNSLKESEIGSEVVEKINFGIIDQNNGEITVLFKDKENSDVLNEQILLRFNLVLFNYNKIESFIYIIESLSTADPLILNKTRFAQIEIEDLFKNKFKSTFDEYAQSNLYLDNIDEFWEFLDFEPIKEIENNKLSASFLNNTHINFEIKRNSELFGINRFDRYVDFSLDEDRVEKGIFNWILDHAYFNRNLQNYRDTFTIVDLTEGSVSFYLSSEFFTDARLITLNKIK